MKAIMLLVLAVLFTSCMHMGMHMMQNDQQAHQQHQNEPVLEKEVSSGDLMAVATIPPMQVGQEQVLTLKLRNRTTLKPVTGAGVFFHASAHRQEDLSSQHARSHEAEKVADVNITRDLTESVEQPGTYVVTYSSPEPGEQAFMFHVASVNKQKLDPELVIEAHRMIRDASGDQHGSMMMESGHSTSTYLIVGGVIMAAMMAIMLLR